VASSWISFFSYQDDARSNAHQKTEECLKTRPTVLSSHLCTYKILFAKNYANE